MFDMTSGKVIQESEGTECLLALLSSKVFPGRGEAQESEDTIEDMMFVEVKVRENFSLLDEPSPQEESTTPTVTPADKPVEIPQDVQKTEIKSGKK